MKSLKGIKFNIGNDKTEYNISEDKNEIITVTWSSSVTYNKSFVTDRLNNNSWSEIKNQKNEI